MAIERYLVLGDVVKELISAKDLGDLDELVIVILALEERLLLEDHSGEHASKGPNVKRVIVLLEVDQKLWALKISGSDAHIVLLTWMVELGQTPINKPEFAVSMVDHNVVRLDISMHNTFRVAEVKGLEDLEHIVADVEIGKRLVENSKINIAGIYVLHNKSWSLGHRIPHDIDQVNDIDTTSQRLKYLNLTSDLGLLYYRGVSQQSFKVDLPGLRILMTILSLFEVLMPS